MMSKFSKKINIAIIGCGKIAEKHAKILVSKKIKSLNLVAVCDSDKQRAKNFGKKFNVVNFNKIETLLNKIDIDLVVICSSSDSHFKNALTVSKFKKNVIIEKPICLNLRDANKIIKIFDKNNNFLFVVMQNRFNSMLKLLKEIIDKKLLGKITNISIRVWWCRDQSYYNEAKWRGTWKLDGGIFMNQAIHHLDIMTWLMGSVKSLTAIIKRRLVNIETEDSGSAIIDFKNGILGTIEASTALRPKNLENSVTVLGENGNIKIGGPYMNNLETYDLKKKKLALTILQKYKKEKSKNNHYLFYEDVAKHLLKKKLKNKKIINGKEAFKSLELVTGIYQSVIKKKRVYFPLKSNFKNSPNKLMSELKK